MRHRKFVKNVFEIQFKNSLTKQWETIQGFRNVAKALKWIKEVKMDEISDEIILGDPLNDQLFLYSPEQECFREIS